MKVQLEIRMLSDGSIVHDVVMNDGIGIVRLPVTGERGMGDRQAAERIIEVIEQWGVGVERLPNVKTSD